MADYFLCVDGQTSGPFTREAIAVSASPEALFWTEGMPEWVPVGNLLAASEQDVILQPVSPLPHIGNAFGPAASPQSTVPESAVAPRASTMGRWSFIFGLLSVIPLVGIFAILTGYWSRTSKRPQIGGRTLANVGIILGCASLICWPGYIWYSDYSYRKERQRIAELPSSQAAQSFVKDLFADKRPLGFVRPEITRSFGPITDVEISMNQQTETYRGTTHHVWGIAVFGNERQSFDVMLIKVSDHWVVVEFDMFVGSRLIRSTR